MFEKISKKLFRIKAEVPTNNEPKVVEPDSQEGPCSLVDALKALEKEKNKKIFRQMMGESEFSRITGKEGFDRLVNAFLLRAAPIITRK